MRIVFWQNCLSPHLLPFIVHLMDDDRVDEVVVCAAEDVSTDRKEMGWSVGQYDGLDRCKLYVNPDDTTINALLKEREEESWHWFSGIRAYAFVFKCLKMSLQYNLNRGMISERPNTYDFKHNRPNAKPYWIHRLRFWIQDRKFAKHIKMVFAMGQEAVNYFSSLGMNWQVLPFCYCTEPAKAGAKPLQADRLPQYLYCGSLSAWKEPLTIARALSWLSHPFTGGVKFIGDGPIRTELEKYVVDNKLNNVIELLGTKPQTEVPSYMQQADVLILPSIYDGWGAVVNEALQAGCYVICSDACGASDLLNSEKRLGRVFRRGDAGMLANCMEWCNGHIDEVRADRAFRTKWCEKHINGRAVARYFVEHLTGDNSCRLW